MAATQVLRTDGKASGVALRDSLNETNHAVSAKVVISATGAWADALRGQHSPTEKLRPLRGSHLVLPSWRLPVAQAISLMHPQDGRPVFAFPWEGVTLVGTTDVDHRDDMRHEAAITTDEVAYLMAALHFQFPQLNLCADDIIATYAGVRPVVDTGKADPSKEGRDHVVWQEDGLLTVTGGKLTTFRLIALDALKHAAPLLPGWYDTLRPTPIFATLAATPKCKVLTAQQQQRLQGRYGALLSGLLDAAQEGELEAISGTHTLWVELRWTARSEAVAHLEDLLLRRTRLGLQLRGGGIEHLERIREICQAELGWSDARWGLEEVAYLALWNANYSLPCGVGGDGK